LKKIQLTYLWADESVLVADFAKQRSRRMAEWANDFYKRYGFEVDVKPAPSEGKVPLAQKYALKKSDGVKPNMFLPRYLSEKYAPLYADVDARIAANQQEKDRLERLLDQVPIADSAGRIVIYEAMHPVGEARDRLRAERDGIERRQAAEEIEGDWSAQFREQMAAKFLADKIGEPDRLGIVFAHFQNEFLRMRVAPDIVIGRTVRETDVPMVRLMPIRLLWPFTYIVIDVKEATLRTLAHEIVHAAGHSHPFSVKVVKNLEQRLKFTPRKLSGTVLDRAITAYQNVIEYEALFKEVPGGEFDGATNDIMNYLAEGAEPSDYVLSDRNKDRLEHAFFVQP